MDASKQKQAQNHASIMHVYEDKWRKKKNVELKKIS